MGAIDELLYMIGMGNPPQRDSTPPMDRSFPGLDDLALAQRGDMTYGEPAAGYLNPQLDSGRRGISGPPPRERARGRQTDIYGVGPFSMRGVRPQDMPPVTPMSPDDAALMYRSWLGAQRAGLSKLGFDPGMMVTMPPERSKGIELSKAGETGPEGAMWADNRYPSTQVHEAMHAGARKLEGAGQPIGTLLAPEETLVRGLMQRLFGGIEEGHGPVSKEQSVHGRNMDESNPSRLDHVEQVAREMLMKIGRPMGPR